MTSPAKTAPCLTAPSTTVPSTTACDATRPSTTARGAAAEALAADYLIGYGLTVIARNLRCRGGELDLVCLDGEVLAFVEVRQRSSARFGGALASVTRRKQHKLLHAARYFGQRECAWQCRPWRFDVVAVQGGDVEWIKDAFRAAS